MNNIFLEMNLKIGNVPDLLMSLWLSLLYWSEASPRSTSRSRSLSLLWEILCSSSTLSFLIKLFLFSNFSILVLFKLRFKFAFCSIELLLLFISFSLFVLSPLFLLLDDDDEDFWLIRSFFAERADTACSFS